VLDRDGLRPTPDRIRETLFNWLGSDIRSAQVLDCFAGAGGLGLEAASREARCVTLVEKDRVVANHLQIQCERLKSNNTQVLNVDVRSFLSKAESRFDVVFVDPPYALPELRAEVLSGLILHGLLSPQALIYIEWPVDQEMQLGHHELHWIRQKTAGNVSYAIAQWGVSR